ncbi:MAG: NAD(P)-dependent oxidoreductase [Alphaproteobacteria bacterium]|nr:NAD(P)-dependent oxidoreductase [Alphaproteobacteria bacterium]
MRVGIAGVGRMGAAIAERLIGQGHELLVWNRTAGKTDALTAKGAFACSSPKALAAAAEAIVTILTDADAIETVYDDADGILSDRLDGKLVIDMSSLRPETERALAERVRAKGAAFVECPVGGTVAPAKDGKLLGFAGGEAADVERARPILDALCRRLEHVGPVGAGASVKLAINLPLAVYWQALGEAMTLCRDLGVDEARMVDIFADSSAGPNVLKNRAALVAKALGGEQVPGTFDIDGLRKDLRTMLAEAKGLSAELPVTEATLACYDQSARAGLGNLDGAQQSAFWRDRQSD